MERKLVCPVLSGWREGMVSNFTFCLASLCFPNILCHAVEGVGEGTELKTSTTSRGWAIIHWCVIDSVNFRRERGQPQFWRKHGPYPCGIRGGGRSLVPHVCMWTTGRLRDIQPGQNKTWEGTGRGTVVSTGEGPNLPTFPTAKLRRQMSELAPD